MTEQRFAKTQWQVRRLIGEYRKMRTMNIESLTANVLWNSSRVVVAGALSFFVSAGQVRWLSAFSNGIA